MPFRRPFLVGHDAKTDEPLYLRPERLETHLHVMGPPGSGKTRLLLWLFQQLTRQPDATIVMFNPKGALCRMARDWAMAHGLTKRLALFDPSDDEVTVGYNPLRPNGLPVATHAKAAREAIRAAWGQTSFDQTPQLARLLFLTLFAARELGLTLVDALDLIRPSSRARRSALDELRDPYVREQLAYFDDLRDTRQEELAASTVARLEAFVLDPIIRRLLTEPGHALDIANVIAERQILLINLEQYQPLRPDDVKLLGRLLMNDLLAHVFDTRRRRGPVYVIVDEVQMFATADLCTALDQGRELGFHCILAHQYPRQLLAEDGSGRLLDSIWECARTKAVFGGSSVESLERITKELLIDQFDPMRVKDELTSLELDPIESRREVVAHGRSSSETEGSSYGSNWAHGHQYGFSSTVAHGTSKMRTVSSGHATAQQSSAGNSIATLPNDDEVITLSAIDGEALTDSNAEALAEGSNEQVTESVHESTSEQYGESVSRTFARTTAVSEVRSLVPFYEYRKRRNVSSRTFFTETEFLTMALQKIKAQPTGHFVLKVPDRAAVFVRAPFVRTPLIGLRARTEARKRIMARPVLLPPERHEPGAPICRPPRPQLADSSTARKLNTNDAYTVTNVRRRKAKA